MIEDRTSSPNFILFLVTNQTELESAGPQSSRKVKTGAVLKRDEVTSLTSRRRVFQALVKLRAGSQCSYGLETGKVRKLSHCLTPNPEGPPPLSSLLFCCS